MLLKEWCSQSERLAGGGSCFVWPPVGSYQEHLSECCPGMFKATESRPSCWHQDWACPGTRPLHGPLARPKTLMLPVVKGCQVELTKMEDKDFEGSKFIWHTWLDPKMALYMTASTERQRRAGRKQVLELRNKRCIVEDKEQVPSNKKSFLQWCFSVFGHFMTLYRLFHLTSICGPCPPPPSGCILSKCDYG